MPTDTLPENDLPEQAAQQSASDRVTATTIAGYLIGQRDCILQIARCPQSVLIGAILVLSAGFAREYDGEDLLAEPWHLLIPHVASLVTSLILYILIRINAWRAESRLPPLIAGSLTFLGLYWMTAPLAWLYAIPFERWTAPATALRLNMMLLALVSIWRVVLIIRVIRVVYGAGPLWHVAATVLMFGDAVMLLAFRFLPVPILHFMGGVRLTEAESVLQGTAFLLQLCGYPFLLLVFGTFLLRPNRDWPVSSAVPVCRTTLTTWLAAFLTIAVWFGVLPLTQPEQRLRRSVERDLTTGHIDRAIQLMSQHSQSDFPPHWTPPPHIALSSPSPPITDVLPVVVSEQAPEWVREMFLEKFRRQLPTVISRFGVDYDRDRSSWLPVLEQLTFDDWYVEDDWRMDDVVATLRALAAGEEGELSDEESLILENIITKLPAVEPQEDGDATAGSEQEPAEPATNTDTSTDADDDSQPAP